MRHAGRGFAWFVSAALVSLGCLAGCSQPFFRLQSDDEEKEKEKAKKLEIRSIGAVSTVSGAEPILVEGVGIVEGLAGTGGPSPSDGYRLAALRELKQRGVEKPALALESLNLAVVRVSAVFMPGARKGDPMDVEVEIPSGHKGTSLRGGYLLECDLFEFADTHDLRGGQGEHAAKKGRALAKAEGRIIAGLGDNAAKDRERRGKILSGGKAARDANFILVLNRESQDGRIAKIIQERINDRFYAPFRDSGIRGMAQAKNDQTVTLNVPAQYKHNWQRYLRVVRQIPLRDEAGGKDNYRKKHADDLLDPSKCVAAALKLEAFGKDCVPDFQKALKSADPLVRFVAAESLAYLDEPGCAGPLKASIEEEERFRVHGLTALASLDEAICHVKLRELMEQIAPETRYGAFRALRTLDPKDPALATEKLSDTFYLHCVAKDAKDPQPLVHISTNQRPEVVLFGTGYELVAPFVLRAGPTCVVTATESDGQCIITRVADNGEPRKEPCSFRLDDVIRKLHSMGAGYPEVTELLIEASQTKNLNCPLAIDALPRASSIYELAKSGQKPDGDATVPAVETGNDLGTTPSLFTVPKRASANDEKKPAKVEGGPEYVPIPK